MVKFYKKIRCFSPLPGCQHRILLQMLNFDVENKKLLYQYEVLRSRLCIREIFLKTIVTEVYENVGQMLSIVRVRLASYDGKIIENKTEDISASGDIIGQSIKDLRTMCRYLYPDFDITEDGFIRTLETMVNILHKNTKVEIRIKGLPKNAGQGQQLIIFNIMYEILISIEEIKGEYNYIVVAYTRKDMTFTLSYRGEDIDWDKKKEDYDLNKNLTLTERLQLIEGTFSTKKSKTGITRIELKTPLKVFYYE